MEDTVNRIVERRFPELVSGYHLPRFARVVAVADPLAQAGLCDEYRPRYAVDVQVLDADGEPDSQTPLLAGVPLPIPAGGNEQGFFGFPEEGTLVVISFAYGLPHKPFILQILPHDLTLPPLARGDQLWQHSDHVNQRADAHGNWLRQTDQGIHDRSSERAIEAINNHESYQSSEQVVAEHSHESVGGVKSLEALGALRLDSAGTMNLTSLDDMNLATASNVNLLAAGNQHCTVGVDLHEDIQGLRTSIANISQRLQAPRTWLGSETINVLQVLIELLTLVERMNMQLAGHQHAPGAPPNNKDAFAKNSVVATSLANSLKTITG